MQFNEGGCPTLENLMTQKGLEGQIEAARILRQLAVLSKEVDLPDTQTVRDTTIGLHPSICPTLLGKA